MAISLFWTGAKIFWFAVFVIGYSSALIQRISSVIPKQNFTSFSLVLGFVFDNPLQSGLD
jgi:hypothetical protein